MHFLSVLHQGLLRLQLPLEYIAMFVHAADVQDNSFRHRAKQYLVANVKRRREFLSKHTSFTNNPKLLFAILPDFVLAYAIHLLAHDPDWSSIDDTARLLSIKSAVWFVLEPIMSGANNYSFLRRLLELIKHSRDALCPEDDLACALLQEKDEIAPKFHANRSSYKRSCVRALYWCVKTHCSEPKGKVANYMGELNGIDNGGVIKPFKDSGRDGQAIIAPITAPDDENQY
ncbi:unnamed protein product [Dibothriocephalus latus]|uniref:Uncharacterized protein n=1 Tax=Dibothriocephalus latus TaxID=60516 RepID=A0A3P7LB07_DIBLA|nr:unnamed protein product [Dibothriocephalus latus]